MKNVRSNRFSGPDAAKAATTNLFSEERPAPFVCSGGRLTLKIVNHSPGALGTEKDGVMLISFG